MKFAVIKSGGKQYKVSEKDIVNVEKIAGKEKSKITFDEVLLISNEGKVKIGRPIVEKSVVEAQIIGENKGEKVKIFKFKPKKRYKKSSGHRQRFTQVRITKISA